MNDKTICPESGRKTFRQEAMAVLRDFKPNKLWQAEQLICEISQSSITPEITQWARDYFGLGAGEVIVIGRGKINVSAHLMQKYNLRDGDLITESIAIKIMSDDL